MRLIRQLCVIVLLSLILAEVGARLFLPQPGLQPFPPNQPAQLLIEHPDRSYAYRPGFSGVVHDAPHEINVTINELGMRDDPVLPGEHIDVLAIGDSFTVGYMIRADEAWPERLEHYLRTSGGSSNTRVLNSGVSGYSLKQIRLAAENYSGLQPDMVIAGVLPAVADRLINPYQWFEGYAVRAEKIPYLRKTEDGFLTALPDSRLSPKTQFWLMQNWRFPAALWLAVATRQSTGSAESAFAAASPADLFARLLGELGKLDEFTKANGQQLIVLLIGFQQPDGSFSEAVKQQNKTVMEFCLEHNIPVFDPVPLFEATSKDSVFRIDQTDYHWTPLAHEIAAAGLAGYITAVRNQD